MEEGNDASEPFLHTHFRDPSTLYLPGLPPSGRSFWKEIWKSCWMVVVCFMAIFLILVVPLFRFIYVKASSSSQQLVFQPLVILFGGLISSTSFACSSQIVWKHRMKGILFLNEVNLDMEEKFRLIIKNCHIQFAKLFIPLFCLYVAHKLWLYLTVSLEPLPFGFNRTVDTIAISVALGLSWTFGTGIYLYACILFGEVCILQETKIRVFDKILARELNVGFYFKAYKMVLKCLKATSRRFRFFLAMTGCITVCSFLVSLYEIVDNLRTGTGILLSGDLLIINIVNVTGWFFCLRRASRIAHLHRRVLKTASSMHLAATVEATKLLRPSLGSEADVKHRMDLISKFQVDWAGRAALGMYQFYAFVIFRVNSLPDCSYLCVVALYQAVDFLSNNTAGISVYGFVLDRFFVHTSIGALATTTWFVLGRSLS